MGLTVAPAFEVAASAKLAASAEPTSSPAQPLPPPWMMQLPVDHRVIVAAAVGRAQIGEIGQDEVGDEVREAMRAAIRDSAATAVMQAQARGQEPPADNGEVNATDENIDAVVRWWWAKKAGERVVAAAAASEAASRALREHLERAIAHALVALCPVRHDASW